MAEKVAVIGAGIAGLAAAYELQKAGQDVVVIEASEKAGGVIQTLKEDGFLFEAGPNSFPSTAKPITEFAEELGIADRMLAADEAAKTRFLYHKHQLMEIPTGPKAFLKTKIFTFPQKLRMFCEPFIPKYKSETPESIAQFVARRLGTAPARTLVDAFVSGIYAGDARRIGIRSAFPKVWEMEQEHGSLFKAMKAMKKKRKQEGGTSPAKMTIMTFKDGMSELVNAAVDKLGDGLLLGRELKEMARRDGGGWELSVDHGGNTESIEADRVLIAAPARTAGMLFTKLNPMAADILFDIDHAPIISVHAGFKESELPGLPKGFGFLAPRPERLRTLGWLFSSQTFEGRAPEGHFGLTGFIGGANDRAALNASDDSLKHLLMNELSMALEMQRVPVPSFFRIVKWSPGLPQYNTGHDRRVEAVRKLVGEFDDLALAGSYLGGVSVADCIKGGREAARELLGGGAGGEKKVAEAAE